MQTTMNLKRPPLSPSLERAAEDAVGEFPVSTVQRGGHHLSTPSRMHAPMLVCTGILGCDDPLAL